MAQINLKTNSSINVAESLIKNLCKNDLNILELEGQSDYEWYLNSTLKYHLIRHSKTLIGIALK